MRLRRLLPIGAALPLLGAVLRAEPALTTAEIEELAFRTYLYARLGDKEQAVATGGRVLEQRPDHTGVLLALASLWETDQDPERLHDAASRILAYAPDNDQALFFKAAADYLRHRYAETRATLLETRRLNFSESQKFPYHTTLAAASARAGDWRTAIFSGTRLVEEGGTYDVMAANRRAYDAILREHRPSIEAAADHAEAPRRYAVTTLRSAITTPVSVHTSASAELATLRATIRPGRGEIAASSNRTRAGAAVEYVVSPEWILATGAGVTDGGDADLSAAVTHHASRVRHFGIEGAYARPADDDARYSVANLKQTRLLAHYSDLWTDRTGGHLALGPRSLHTAQETPSDWGWILSGEIFHHSRQRIPKLTPYAQTLWLSNPDNAGVSAALTRLRDDGRTANAAGTFDLQKAGLRADLPLRTKYALGADAYAGTSLRAGGFLYGFMGEFRWRPAKTIVLRLNAGWDKGTLFGEFPYGVASVRASLAWNF